MRIPTITTKAILLVITLYLMISCGQAKPGENTNSSGEPFETGDISLKLIWDGSDQNPSQPLRTKSKAIVFEDDGRINCEESGIDTIYATVFGPGDLLTPLHEIGSTWPCHEHTGQLTQIPVGDRRKLVCLAKDTQGNIIYRGQQDNITIESSQNQAPQFIKVDMNSFMAESTFPEGDGEINTYLVEFQCTSVPGANQYRLQLSTQEDFSTFFIDKFSDGPFFSSILLSDYGDYYWRISAVDVHGFTGIWSEIRRFFLTRTDLSPTSLTPAADARNIDPATAIFATYSKALDCSTFDLNSIMVSFQDPDTDDTVTIAGIPTCNGSTAGFVPGSLTTDKTYTVTIKAGVNAFDGHTATDDFSWSFETKDTLSPSTESFSYTEIWRSDTITTGDGNDIVTIDGIILESTLDTGAGSDTIRANELLRSAVLAGDGVNEIYVATTAYDSEIVSGIDSDHVTIEGDVTRLILDTGESDDHIIINGNVYEGTLQTGSGNDVLEIGGTDFVRGTIDMGIDYDTLELQGPRSAYTIEYTEGHYILDTANQTHVYNVELIVFGDGVKLINGVEQ